MGHFTSATRILLFLLICAASNAYGAVLYGKVVEVPEGDLISVQYGGTVFKVRLVTITPPKGEHPLREVARKHLWDLTHDRDVLVKPLGLEGAIITGFVFYAGNDVGIQMVRDGAAWYDDSYASRMDASARSLYEQSEQAARDEKRGVWDGSVVAVEGRAGGLEENVAVQPTAPQVQRPALQRPQIKPQSAVEKAKQLNDAGYVLIKQNQYGAAYPLIAQAAQLDPTNADAHKNLCIIFSVSKRLEESLAQCVEAIKLRPDFDKAYQVAGHTLHLMGRKDEALQAYRQAIRLNPRYAKAHHNLGCLLFDMGRYKESVVSFLRAEELGFEEPPRLNVNLGMALYRLGRKQEARARWRRVLTMAGDEEAVMLAQGNLRLP
jgi:tetratricopeptide (TPR) repeat protein